MPNFKVTGSFCLDIENAEDAQDAIDQTMEQLQDAERYLSLEAAFDIKVERQEEETE